jgi:hypothetical protein
MSKISKCDEQIKNTGIFTRIVALRNQKEPEGTRRNQKEPERIEGEANQRTGMQTKRWRR